MKYRIKVGKRDVTFKQSDTGKVSLISYNDTGKIDLLFPAPPQLREEDITTFLQALDKERGMHTAKIKVINLELIKIIIDKLIKYNQKIDYDLKILLSKESEELLKAEAPEFLHKIKQCSEQIKNREKKLFHPYEILLALSKSKEVSLVDLRVYLFLLATQLKMVYTKSSNFQILDYEFIAEKLKLATFQSKKTVFKSIDKLKKKRLISLNRVKHIKFLLVNQEGPIDLDIKKII